MAGDADSELSRGGMRTKVEAAKIATTGGTHMLIASGKIEHPLQAIADGGRCTWFLTPANPITSRKRWIAGTLEPKGTLTIDAGAVAALRAGASLLPAGVIKVEGQFARGDAVIVRGPDTSEVGRGLIAYDAEVAERIKGRSSPDVMAILGISGQVRDDPSRRSGGGRVGAASRQLLHVVEPISWRPCITRMISTPSGSRPASPVPDLASQWPVRRRPSAIPNQPCPPRPSQKRDFRARTPP